MEHLSIVWKLMRGWKDDSMHDVVSRHASLVTSNLSAVGCSHNGRQAKPTSSLAGRLLDRLPQLGHLLLHVLALLLLHLCQSLVHQLEAFIHRRSSHI